MQPREKSRFWKGCSGSGKTGQLGERCQWWGWWRAPRKSVLALQWVWGALFSWLHLSRCFSWCHSEVECTHSISAALSAPLSPRSRWHRLENSLQFDYIDPLLQHTLLAITHHFLALQMKFKILLREKPPSYFQWTKLLLLQWEWTVSNPHSCLLMTHKTWLKSAKRGCLWGGALFGSTEWPHSSQPSTSQICSLWLRLGDHCFAQCRGLLLSLLPAPNWREWIDWAGWLAALLRWPEQPLHSSMLLYLWKSSALLWPQLNIHLLWNRVESLILFRFQWRYFLGY